MRLTVFVAPAFAGLLLATAAHAQTSTAGQANSATHAAAATAANSQSGSLTATDQKFLHHVAQGADYELTLAKLAEQKAAAQDVKHYAQTIANDHEQLNSSLHKLAQRHDVQLSPQLDKRQHEKVSDLKDMSGKAFDQAYVNEMRRINREDKIELQKEITHTQNPDVKTFAQDMQSADAKHQQLAQKLEVGS